MKFLSELSTRLQTHGFDWVFCVFVYILVHPQKYGEFVKSYKCLTEYLNNINGLSNSGFQCEEIISDTAPLPNGGCADFFIWHRNISETQLTGIINNFATTLYPDKKMVLIFEPTEQLVNSGDTSVSLYKIESQVAIKL